MAPTIIVLEPEAAVNVVFWQFVRETLLPELSLYQHESTATLSPAVKLREIFALE